MGGGNGKGAVLEIHRPAIDWGGYLPDSGAPGVAAECLVLFCSVQYRNRSLDLGTHTSGSCRTYRRHRSRSLASCDTQAC